MEIGCCYGCGLCVDVVILNVCWEIVEWIVDFGYVLFYWYGELILDWVYLVDICGFDL